MAKIGWFFWVKLFSPGFLMYRPSWIQSILLIWTIFTLGPRPNVQISGTSCQFFRWAIKSCTFAPFCQIIRFSHQRQMTALKMQLDWSYSRKPEEAYMLSENITFLGTYVDVTSLKYIYLWYNCTIFGKYIYIFANGVYQRENCIGQYIWWHRWICKVWES